VITTRGNHLLTTDLMNIARSGVDASNQLLNTTGQNIANVNTEGYVRQRTTLVAELTGGVGRSTTERILNTFAQNQLRRDTTQYSHFEEYWITYLPVNRTVYPVALVAFLPRYKPLPMIPPVKPLAS
jgi:hypothetical protein